MLLLAFVRVPSLISVIPWLRVLIGLLLVAGGALLFVFANHLIDQFQAAHRVLLGRSIGMLYIGAVVLAIAGGLTILNKVKNIVPDD